MKYVYLCGPIRGLHNFEARDWRNNFKGFFNQQPALVKGLDPMRKHTFEVSIEADKKSILLGPSNAPISQPKVLVSRDLGDIDRSSLVLVNLNHHTTMGTSAEIGYAYAKGIPIVFVIPPEHIAQAIHPFVEVMATAIFPDEQDAFHFIEDFLGD